MRIIGWTCDHYSVTSIAGMPDAPTALVLDGQTCGCDMWPVYEDDK